MIKLLSVGNSFSQDAQRWLSQFAAGLGVELFAQNLYIGGCSLSRHHQNMHTGEAAYLLETNGEPGSTTYIGLHEALALQDWDVITLQQVSHKAGRPETYEPYLGDLVRTVRAACPGAKLYFQQTWEYEYCSTHSGFPYFECSCDLMYGATRATVGGFAAKYDLTVIPSGDAVHAAKRLPAFDTAHDPTAQSLYRDAFHMHLLYGRYLLACVWFRALTGRSPIGSTFAPEEADPVLLAQLRAIADTLHLPASSIEPTVV